MDPRLLVVEALFGIVLRYEQVEVLKTMTSEMTRGDSAQVHQLIMGMEKVVVIDSALKRDGGHTMRSLHP